MENVKRPVRIVFWALISVFLIILCQFFVPVFGDLLQGSVLFLFPVIVFCLLGLALLILVLREKAKDRLKKFLILTGSSAFGFFIFVALHNAFYAFGIITKETLVLHYLMEGLSVVFFLTAIIVCPIGFLVGVIGSIILLIGKK